MSVDRSDFWRLAELAVPNGDGGFFDSTVHRAFELAHGLPRGCVAWMKADWPGVSLYLYDTSADGQRLEELKGTANVFSAERPRDPSDVDWVVKILVG